MDISAILPIVNERDNLRILLPRIDASLEREKLSYEIVVIDGNSIDGTREAENLGARVVTERRRGFAGALVFASRYTRRGWSIRHSLALDQPKAETG
jgi:glycosyltransferase involved in cell wall biosynthesis